MQSSQACRLCLSSGRKLRLVFAPLSAAARSRRLRTVSEAAFRDHRGTGLGAPTTIRSARPSSAPRTCHTGLSFDASIRFVDYASGNDPRGAYRFAPGQGAISIPEPSGLQPKRRASCNDPATEPSAAVRAVRPALTSRSTGAP